MHFYNMVLNHVLHVFVWLISLAFLCKCCVEVGVGVARDLREGVLNKEKQGIRGKLLHRSLFLKGWREA